MSHEKLLNEACQRLLPILENLKSSPIPQEGINRVKYLKEGGLSLRIAIVDVIHQEIGGLDGLLGHVQNEFDSGKKINTSDIELWYPAALSALYAAEGTLEGANIPEENYQKIKEIEFQYGVPDQFRIKVSMSDIAQLHLVQARHAQLLIEDPSGFLLVDHEVGRYRRIMMKTQENNPDFLLPQLTIKLVELGAQRYKNYYQACQND